MFQKENRFTNLLVKKKYHKHRLFQ